MKALLNIGFVIIIAILFLNLLWMHSVNQKLVLIRSDISAIPDKLKIEKHVTQYPSAEQIAKQLFKFEKELEAKEKAPAVFEATVSGVGRKLSGYWKLTVYFQQRRGVASEVAIVAPADISVHDFEVLNMASKYPRYRSIFVADDGSFPEEWEFYLTFLNYEMKTESRAYQVSFHPENEGTDVFEVRPLDQESSENER